MEGENPVPFNVPITGCFGFRYFSKVKGGDMIRAFRFEHDQNSRKAEILYIAAVKHIFQYFQTFLKSMHILTLGGGQGDAKYVFTAITSQTAHLQKKC